MNKTTAIILAAGKGTRMNSKINKQYIEINNKPILAYTIEKFQKAISINNIILVVGKNEKDYVKNEIVNKFCFDKVTEIILGGKERQDSVYEGIKKINEDTDVVLVHDGARPLIEVSDIEKLINEVIKYKACILGVKVKDTIKIVGMNNIIQETPNRENLYAAQTPQGFDKDIIVSAYTKGIRDGRCFTDDSMIVEQYEDIKIKIIEGSYKNIKITTKEDLEIAKKYFENHIIS